MQEQDYESATNEELLALFVESRDHRLKQELVLRYSYIVKAIALQMRGVYVSFAEMDDIINEGIIALMAALDKFDPSKNVKFNSYASLRVRGAVIDLARKQDWVPRSVRKFAKEADNASNELFIKLGHTPTDDELALHLGMSQEKYKKAMGKTGLYNLLSLDALMDEAMNGSMPHYGLPTDTSVAGSPTESLSQSELYSVLRDAVAQLRPKEQMVISLYYRKDLNMKEIAKVLDVSEPRISQILAGALQKLRKSLSKYMDEGPGQTAAR